MEILGVPLIWLPRMSHPDGSGTSGSGLLVPDIRISRLNGFELSLPYYLTLAPNRDLTLTPHLYTEVMPGLEVQYREMTALGPYRLGGFITYGSRVPASAEPVPGSRRRDARGYVYGNGQFQLDPDWRITFSGRLTTDDTFLRRYALSRDDRLRNFPEAGRIGTARYFSIAGWAGQTQRGKR